MVCLHKIFKILGSVNYPNTKDGWASNTKKMRTLTLNIELFVHHSLLFRLYNLLCRTAQHAQPFVPKVNLICTNIFMCKVLRKNNFSSNHSTSKNLITNVQNLFLIVKWSLTSHRLKERWVLRSVL